MHDQKEALTVKAVEVAKVERAELEYELHPLEELHVRLDIA